MKLIFLLLIFFCISFPNLSCQATAGTLSNTLESCQTLVNSGKILEANKCYVEAFILHPGNTEKITEARDSTLRGKCLELLRTEKKYSEAGFCFESLVLHAPNNAEYHYHLATSYLYLYKNSELKDEETITNAEKAILTSIELDPLKAKYHGTYGRILEQQDKFNAALGAYKYAIKIDPKNYLFWISKALLQRKLGKHRESIDSYLRVLELKPNYELALYDIGTAYERIGEVDKAIESFERLVKINKEYDDVQERLTSLRKTKRTGVKTPFRENMKEGKPEIKILP